MRSLNALEGLKTNHVWQTSVRLHPNCPLQGSLGADLILCIVRGPAMFAGMPQ